MVFDEVQCNYDTVLFFSGRLCKICKTGLIFYGILIRDMCFLCIVGIRKVVYSYYSI